MFKQTIFFGFALGMLVAFNTTFHVVSGNETQKTIPASLDEATTSAEIAAYAEHVFQESRKNLKTTEDQDRFLETYPPIGIAAGRKIIALGGDDESLKKGYEILLNALDWSSGKYPESTKEYERVVEEIKKTGKFPELVDSARFFLFYQRNRSFSDKIAKNEFGAIKDEFDAMKEEAKELITLKQTGHSSTAPMELVLGLAQKISIAHNNPQFLDDVLEDFVSFLTSDRFVRKKENEAFLRGVHRRLVGSPFELWGKTVDGNDFNWTDYKEKVILVNFTASWCGPCREEMPNIVEMHEKYHKKGLEIVFIGVRDTTDNLKKMTEEDKVGFPMISEELSQEDSRGLPSTHYSIFGVPSIFLVDKNGRIIATGLRDHVLRDTIEKHFAEKGEVNDKEVK